MDYIAKVLHNKANNQLSIVLAKRKLKFLKNKIPKLIQIKEMKVLE